MAEMQDSLNKVKFPDWRDRQLDWDSAILVETAELIEHLDFKWWSKERKGPDYDQARMEAVDILHFLLSRIYEPGVPGKLHLLAFHAQPSFEMVPTGELPPRTVIMRAKNFLAWTLQGGADVSALHSFATLLVSLNLSFDELYRLYVGKWCLNQVRWSNDYGKSYIKIWFGEEDNQFLTRLVSGMDPKSESFAEDVEKALRARYEEVKAGAQ